MSIKISNHTIPAQNLLDTANAKNKPKEQFGKKGLKDTFFGILKTLGKQIKETDLEKDQKSNRQKLEKEIIDLTAHIKQLRMEIKDDVKSLKSKTIADDKRKELGEKIYQVHSEWDKTTVTLKQLRKNISGTKVADTDAVKALFRNANQFNRVIQISNRKVPAEVKAAFEDKKKALEDQKALDEQNKALEEQKVLEEKKKASEKREEKIKKRMDPGNISLSKPNHPELKERTEKELAEVTLFIQVKGNEALKNFEGGNVKVGKYNAGLLSAIGFRESMEDSYILEEIVLGNGTKVPIFAVMDGHGGDEFSKAIEEHFPTLLKEELDSFDWDTANLQEKHDFFKKASDKLQEKIVSLYPKSDSGSTMTAAIIIKNQIWTLNTGDSRTVLNNGGKAVQLSEDATFEKEKFMKGVLKRDGKVEVEDGIKRLGGVNMPRSYGDASIKGMTHLPKITVFDLENLSKEKPSQLIIACDGLWDVVGSKKAVRLLTEKTPEDNATKLVEEALKKGSQDNVTVMVIDIPKLSKEG